MREIPYVLLFFFTEPYISPVSSYVLVQRRRIYTFWGTSPDGGYFSNTPHCRGGRRFAKASSRSKEALFLKAFFRPQTRILIAYKSKNKAKYV
jgi:hypothetical protein